MALFRKKKEDVEVKKTENTGDDTLDLIKQTMQEANEAKMNAANEMPSAEEIKQAQEVLARAQMSQAPSGSNLKTLVAEFMQDRAQDKLNRVLECLKTQGTMVCVPAQIKTDKVDEEKIKQGGQVKLDGPVQISPVILTDNNGVKVLPIFTDESAIPDELKNRSPKVNMPFANCISLMKNIPELDTIALDPYTANIRIAVSIEKKEA